MSRLGTWFRSSVSTNPAAKNTNGLTPGEQEISDLEDALSAAARIMNDDIAGAEDRLSARKDDSTFHMLGFGVSVFLRSLLGFEKQMMAEASSRLVATETQAWSEQRKAQKNGGAIKDSIYPPGTEFALVHAEAQLMGAVVGVMHESLTEGVKSFYKLRKAFVNLDSIMEAEAKMLQSKGYGVEKVKTEALAGRPSLAEDHMPGCFDETEFDDYATSGKASGGKQPVSDKDDEDSDLNFVDAEEEQSGSQTPAGYTGHLIKESSPKSSSGSQSRASTPINKLSNLQITDTPSSSPASPKTPRTLSLPTAEDPLGPDSKLFNNPVDVFVHSGANMCFGILLLLISMVPPAFSKLLYIVGFKGDRDRGVRMLWQSTRFPNINGAVAGIILLAYYNGLLAFSDILPTEEDAAEAEAMNQIVGYPRKRCNALLASMREQYPESRLWKLEEARVFANTRRLEEAVGVLRNSSDSKMRQVRALSNFELSLNSMSLMDWATAAPGFIRCVELNDWSHALYYYLAGCAELEMYRDAFHAEKSLATEEGRAEKTGIELEQLRSKCRQHKKAAEAHFVKAPTVASRRRFMAKQLPFEAFAIRKVQKWTDRASALAVDLVDAVGSSPAMEMAYLWNGSKRMRKEGLEKALSYLSWDRCTCGPEELGKIQAEKDEISVKAIAETAIVRTLAILAGDLEGLMERCAEARKILDEGVLRFSRADFKGPTKDDYPLPSAHYEVAVLSWVEARALSEHSSVSQSQGADDLVAKEKQRVLDCDKSLTIAAGWEGFILDARIGMRIRVGQDTVKWYREKKSWA